MSVLPARANAALLGVFWFGIQVVWGAILSIALQARSVALAPREGLRDYAVLAAVGALLAAAVQIGIGPLADRRRGIVGHRLEFYALGVGAALPTLGWFFVAPAYWQLVVAFLVLQVTMNVAVGPYQAVIPDYVAPAQSGGAAAWMASLQSLGNACGLVVAGFVSRLAVVGGVLAAVLAATYAVTALHLRRVVPRPAADVAIALDAPFRTLLASRGCINLGFYTLLGFLFFYVRDSLHAADARTGTAIAFLSFTLCGILGAVLGGRPADRYDKRVVVSVANAVGAVCLLGVAAASRLEVAYAAAACAGLAWGAFFTADWALACTVLPRGAMASAMGIWNVATTLPQVLAPLVTAPLIAAANRAHPGLGPRAAIVLATCEFTVGALWLWRLPAAAALPARADGGVSA